MLQGTTSGKKHQPIGEQHKFSEFIVTIKMTNVCNKLAKYIIHLQK